MAQESDMITTVTMAIKQSLDEAIKIERERVIQEAIQDFTHRVQSRVGNSVLNVLDFYSVERHERELVIHVKIEGKEPL